MAVRVAERAFARHFVEMLAAMLLGMLVLGGAFAGLLALGGLPPTEAERDAPGLVAAAMTASMTAPMAWWMRHRGMPWPRVVEMSGAMVAVSGALVVVFAAGALSASAMLEAQHGGMIAAMLGAMLLRRGTYAVPPGAAVQQQRTRPDTASGF